MRQAGFFAKLAFVLLIFAVLFSYAMFQGGFVSWFLFFAFSPFLIYMFALLVYPISNWEIERHLSKRVAVAGEKVEVEVILKRRYAFPIYYCVIEEYFPDSLKKTDTHLEKYHYINQPDYMEQPRKVKRVLFPWFKRTIRYTYELPDLPRGEHKLKALRIKTGDFFGFVKKEHVSQNESSLLVFPYQRKVRLKERVHSFDRGASPSITLNEKNTNIVTGVREYMPGDRFSWIDWKATARKNAIMTKEFEQEKSVEMMLILNAVYHSNLNRLAFEGCVELCASLLEELRKSSSQLAFMTLGDGAAYFPLHQDYSQKQMIQRHLAQVKPIGRIPFAQQLEREQGQLPSGLISMIVTSRIDGNMQKAIEKLMQKSKRVILFFIHPSDDMTFGNHQLLKQLSYKGVTVNVLTEEQLIQQEFEVNT
ncbi:DUF58 domain-containing protein [Thalassobacillus sp. CUG 92003]|uniref:DUF58 domain-containing protein n=1 Tax=Thalassobacillus sp. CUG 92003 TaxID=2736641 RepID=UPI0015E6D740|nr:DUF58 domain-containing protein [Thalassobacillus sp. CUG 92003]